MHRRAEDVQRGVAVFLKAGPGGGLDLGVGARGAHRLGGALPAVAAVALKLRREPLKAALQAVGDGFGDQAPAHVLIELETVDAAAVVGQREHALDAIRFLRRADQNARPDDAEVLLGGGEEAVPGEVEELGGVLQPVLLGDVAPDGVKRAAGDGLRDFQRVLAGKFVGGQRDELTGGELLVAHHVPQRVPEEQTLEGRLEAVDLLAHERERAEVERDLGESVVGVVGEDGGRGVDADQPLDHSLCAIKVDGHGVAQHGPVVARVVDGNLGAMRPQVGMVRGSALLHRERVDRAVGDAEVRGDRVDAGAFEPELRPAPKLASGAAFERGEEIRQRRIAPGVSAEIVAHSLAEAVVAEEGDQLLQHGCPLAVGDAVEIEECRVGVRHLAGDRVGGRQLILLVGPGFHPRVKGGPGVVAEARRALHREVGHVGGERLVEPEVVPPLHRDEVAEPHMRHLVEHHFGAVEPLNFGRRVAEDHPLRVGDAAHILHRAHVELGHEDLVVLPEGVAKVEEVGVETEPLAGDLEKLVGVEVLLQRGAAEDAQRGVLPAVVEAHVGPGGEREQVGAEARRRLKPPPRARAALDRLRLGGGVVAHDFPLRRRGHGQVVGRLEVGLVEAGQQAVRVVGLEVGVEVLRAVFGIDELVQPRADVVVVVAVADAHLVVGGQIRAVEEEAVALMAHGALRAVDLDRMNLASGEVEERAVGRRGVREARDGFGVVGLGPGAEREVERVGDIADRRGARFGLGLGQHIRACRFGHRPPSAAAWFGLDRISPRAAHRPPQPRVRLPLPCEPPTHQPQRSAPCPTAASRNARWRSRASRFGSAAAGAERACS